MKDDIQLSDIILSSQPNNQSNKNTSQSIHLFKSLGDRINIIDQKMTNMMKSYDSRIKSHNDIESMNESKFLKNKSFFSFNN
jgi:hypothetical protein